jgi:hypothetical protein
MEVDQGISLTMNDTSRTPDSFKEDDKSSKDSDLNNNSVSGCLGCLLIIGTLGTITACAFNVLFVIGYLISLPPSYIRIGGEANWGMNLIFFGILVTSSSLLFSNGLGIAYAKNASDNLFYKYSFISVSLMTAIDMAILFIRANFF